VAICGLPPLNGFVSEWLVYLGIFHTVQNGTPLVGLMAAPSLAMTGGLALLCFTKVFGLSFLGQARCSSVSPHESPRSMTGAMAILLAACMIIGVAPLAMLPLLDAATANWSGVAEPFGLAALAPAGRIGQAALLLLLLAAGFALRRNLARGQDRKTMPTWGCGYALAISRVQYTTSSFAQLIVDLFHWFLRTDIRRQKIDGILPTEKSALKSHTPDLILDLLIQPLAAVLAKGAFRLRRLVHCGNIGIYLLYSASVLCLLLFLADLLYS